ncbi:MAG: hypothetical protein JO127_12435 [Caulobacteraceae bacterium]|nr:hypothetical protein [Caulobacteraceae bacterium]
MDVTAAIAVSGVTAAGLKLAVSAPDLPSAREDAAGVSRSGTAGGGGPAGTGRAVTLKPATLLAGDPLASARFGQEPDLVAEIEPVREVSRKANQAYGFSASAGADADGGPPIFDLIG